MFGRHAEWPKVADTVIKARLFLVGGAGCLCIGQRPELCPPVGPHTGADSRLLAKEAPP